MVRRDRVSEDIAAPCEEVFDLVHDYERRLEWDTLLSAAYLTDGHAEAGKGVTSVCVGRRALGKIALKTRYVSFERGVVAAVEMINAPACFGRWAASIRHHALDAGRSRITYTWSFESKPRWLRWLFEPVMARVFRWETRKRLRALRDYFAGGGERRRRTASRPARPSSAVAGPPPPELQPPESGGQQ